MRSNEYIIFQFKYFAKGQDFQAHILTCKGCEKTSATVFTTERLVVKNVSSLHNQPFSCEEYQQSSQPNVQL